MGCALQNGKGRDQDEFQDSDTDCRHRALRACGLRRTGPKQTGGALIGSAVSGLVDALFGSETSEIIAITLGGVLAGAWASGELSKALDDTDKEKMRNTAQK